MTEIAIAKTLTCLVPVTPIAFAVVETSTQVALLNLLTFAVATAGVAFSAWIALKQAQLKKTVDDLEHNTNSMREALVASTREAGVREGVEKAETKAAIVTAAKATGAAEAAAAAHKE